VKEAQTNSVRNLQNLYSIVVGLGLSLSIYNLIDTSREGAPFKLELLPFFLSFLVTLIPFYHGALRHFDATYIEQDNRQVRGCALLADFVILFIESCLLLTLAVLLATPQFFAWGLVTLLALDCVWGFVAHKVFSQETKIKPELRWAIINLVTSVILSVCFIVIDIFPPAAGAGEPKLWAIIFSVSVIRTIIDYVLCWDFYFPKS
jgi:heme/copper-type cytochrome/quinol oxidase subunit 4